MVNNSISDEERKKTMTVHDNGPEPYSFDLETETKENTNYRTTAWDRKVLAGNSNVYSGRGIHRFGSTPR